MNVFFLNINERFPELLSTFATRTMWRYRVHIVPQAPTRMMFVLVILMWVF